MTSSFAAKVAIDITWSRFRILTANNIQMREEALRLRHEVFVCELLGRKQVDDLDQESFDAVCDHLLILEKDSGRTVGTYRFLSSAFSQNFYTQTEFDLGTLLKQTGDKLEMGRACIHPDFRNGFTFIALWKGLAAYIARHPVNILFGCSSSKHYQVEEVALVVDYLMRHGYYSDAYGCSPLAHCAYQGLSEVLGDLQKRPLEERNALDAQCKRLIPPLLSAYLDAGARVMGMPAYDCDFACVDFLTVLQTEQLREDLIRKYKPW